MSYPATPPTSRAFVPGTFGQSSFNAASGGEVRVLYGSVATGHRLSLTYGNITEGEMTAFVSHYQSTQGSFQTFLLPAAVFAGMATAFTVGGNQWRYDDTPEVEAVMPGIYNLTVSLVAVYG